MSLQELKDELRIKAIINKIKDNSSSQDARIYNYIELLTDERKLVPLVFSLIKEIDVRSYDEVAMAVASQSLKIKTFDDINVTTKCHELELIEPIIKDTKTTKSSGMDELQRLLDEARKRKDG